MCSKDKPLYAFGYGLSYTTFAYEGLKLSSPTAPAGGAIHVAIKIKNTGQRATRGVWKRNRCECWQEARATA
jgi:hypothetical protein